MFKHSRKIIALTAALALTSTMGLAALAQAETGKSFSIVEAASNQDSLTIPEIADKCRTSVVAIETETTVVYNTYDNNYPYGLFGFGYGYGYGGRSNRQQEYTETAAGSGIVLSEDGYILTNNHVISGADKITVYVMPEEEGGEETTYEATLVSSSESNDIAILKIDAEGLNPATFGDSDNLEIGELAVAIGNPMGSVHGSVTAGIISATERELTIDGVTISAIQTDAAINPGNSGGALVNEYGQVVGINSNKVVSTYYEGIGFAIPISDASNIISDLMTRGYVSGRSRLGIMARTVTEIQADASGIPVGVLIVSVNDDSPLKGIAFTGDIITEAAGQKISTLEDLYAVLRTHSGGESITVTVYSPGSSETPSSEKQYTIVLLEDTGETQQ